MTAVDVRPEDDRRTTVTPARRRRPTMGRFGFGRISILYVEVLSIVVFMLWVPQTFGTWTTVTGILSDNAITGIVALALVTPLAAGVFDLSVGYSLGATSILCAWLLGNTGLGTVAVCVVSMLFAIGVGCVNAFVVVVCKIDSFIATLATGSLLQSVILIISDDQSLTAGIGPGFTKLGQAKFLQITTPVFVLIGLAIVLWYVLGHTSLGRHVHAAGLAEEPARLAGIRVSTIRFSALVVSSTIAGIAGILVTAVVSAGSSTVGPGYLIPAFAAAFLGATQFRDRVFNAWGTLLAVILLGTITAGLALANTPLWMPYVFQGVVLILALTMGSIQSRGARLRLTSVRDRFRPKRLRPPTEPAPAVPDAPTP